MLDTLLVEMGLQRILSDFEWTPECQVAFEELKSHLVNSPILPYPKADGNIALDTDASNHGLVLFFPRNKMDMNMLLPTSVEH